MGTGKRYIDGVGSGVVGALTTSAKGFDNYLILDFLSSRRVDILSV